MKKTCEKSANDDYTTVMELSWNPRNIARPPRMLQYRTQVTRLAAPLNYLGVNIRMGGCHDLSKEFWCSGRSHKTVMDQAAVAEVSRVSRTGDVCR